MADQRRGGPAAALVPQRKLVPAQTAGGPIGHYHKEQQPQQYAQGLQLHDPPSQSTQVSQFPPAATSSFHSRTRTSSSSVLPSMASSPPPKASNTDRRLSTSNGLSSHQPSSIMSPTQYQSYIHRSGTNNSTNSVGIRRSTSSRTSTSLAPTSYVALMRKQKATVWCDRSQTLDSHTAAQQKAAKHRAALEVHGAANSVRTSTIGSSKVRSAKAGAYAPANFSGVSVPIRLSANEMLGDEEEALEGRSIGGEATPNAGKGGIHQRSSSGRSSVHSGTYPSRYPRSNAGPTAGRFSASSTPPTGNEGAVNYEADYHHHNSNNNNNNNNNNPPNSSNLATEPIRTNSQKDSDSFANPSSHPNNIINNNNNNIRQQQHHYHKENNPSRTETSSSGEEDRFGEAGELKGPPRQSAASIAAEQARRAEELRRRGSVDERTMTMGGKGRLFVANPDLDGD